MALGGLDVQLVYFRNKEGQRSRLCGRADRRTKPAASVVGSRSMSQGFDQMAEDANMCREHARRRLERARSCSATTFNLEF